jgi:hypothetical protein
MMLRGQNYHFSHGTPNSDQQGSWSQVRISGRRAREGEGERARGREGEGNRKTRVGFVGFEMIMSFSTILLSVLSRGDHYVRSRLMLGLGCGP